MLVSAVLWTSDHMLQCKAHETTISNKCDAEGAARETWEEANCQVEILAPYSHFDIPMIGQAYILFRQAVLLHLCHDAFSML